MKKTMLTLLAILALFCVSCTRKNVEMTILTENYPPLSFIENGVVTGYGADVVAAIQTELKTKAVPQILAWDDAYTRALTEPNVVLFTLEKTEERADKFFFLGPLGANTSYFYSLAANPLVLPDLEAAGKVKSISTTTNWFTEQFLKQKGFTNLSSKPDPLDNMKSVINKEAELGVFTDVTYPQLCKEAGVSPDTLKPVLELMKSEYYIAISKATDPKIVKEWETAFAKIKDNGSLENLRNKWFAQK